MSELLDRVAKAIFDASMEHVGRSWPRWEDGATAGARDEARILARAAIAEMARALQVGADQVIEITEAMIRAGCGELAHFDPTEDS